MLAMGLTACGGNTTKPSSKPAGGSSQQGGSSEQGSSSEQQGSSSQQGTSSQGGSQNSLFEEVADPGNHHFGAEEAVAADAEAGSGAFFKAACSDTDCTYSKIRVNQSAVVYAEGSSNKDVTPEGYVKLANNNESLSFKFKVDSLSMGKFYLLGRMDGYSTESNQTAGIYRGNPKAANIQINVNGKKQDLSSKQDYKYSDTFGTENIETGLSSSSANLSHEGYVEVCDVVLNAGVNEVVYKRLGSQNMIVRDFVFVIQPHTHEFGEWAQTKAPTYTELGSAKRSCSCGLEEEKDVNTTAFDIAEDSEVAKLNADGKRVNQYTYNSGAAKVAAVAMKQNSGVFTTAAVEGETEKWTVGAADSKAAAGATTYKLEKGSAILFKVNVSEAVENAFISIGAKYSNANARYFYNHHDGGQNGDKDTEDEYRYYTKVNDGEFEHIAFNALMSDVFGDGKSVCYMPLGKFSLKAGENLIYVRQGNIGYRATLEGNLYIALSGNAEIQGDDAAPLEEVAGAFPSFKWAEAVQDDSATLDGAKFKASSTYILKVKNVPAAGTYTLTLPMKGSSGNGSRTLNTSGTDHDGQGFAVSANDVAGTFLGDGKTYEEFFGADQTAWVDVAFAEIALNAGTNTIKIVTNSAGYRVSLNVNSNITLAAKA